MTSTNDETRRGQVRKARKTFAAMAATYFLGVFNDNFFKQAGMILAVSAGRTNLQGYATVIFSLPFILFAAFAGWLADRFSKRSVIISAKVLELAAMLCGAAGVYLGNWGLMLTMLFIMGLQSAIFNPSLNGTIPELYPACYVTKANAIIRMVSTAAILLGVALAGAALDNGQGLSATASGGRIAVAVVVIAVAALGVLVSLGVPRRRAADPGAAFPWSGPLDTLAELHRIRKDPLLAVTICASVYFWFLGALQLQIINPMGITQFRMGSGATSGLIVAQLVGIAIGGFLAVRLATGRRWHRVLAPAAFVIAVFMVALLGAPRLPESARPVGLFAAMACMGLAGGVFMIPVASFIQIRPAPERKGAVIAAANFASFCGILLSGPAANVMNRWLEPTTSFGAMGLLSVLAGLFLLFVLPRAAAESRVGSESRSETSGHA